MQELQPFEAGSCVADMIIEAPLGQGGFGTVYKACTAEGKDVAVKVSHVPITEISTRVLALQQNEIEALTKLDHPSLVSVRSYGFTSDHRMYLVMDLIEGESLHQYLHRKRRLDVLEAIGIVRKIAEAINHCHEQGVLHLDLKPSNVMVIDPVVPHLKVLDFGLAQLQGFKGGHSEIAGTVTHMAPELFDGTGLENADARADLYSLGIIFYELLTGSLPFKASSHDALLSLRLAGEKATLDKLNPSIHPDVRSLLAELLAHDPAGRWGNAGMLGVRLKELYYVTLHEGAAAAGIVFASADPAVLTETRFVGRSGELTALCSAYKQVLGGGGHAVMIVGEAGVGKSCLVSEVLGSPDVGDAALTISGRCRQLENRLPYLPLREALGQLAVSAKRLHGARVWEAMGEALTPGILEVVGRLVPEFLDMRKEQDEHRRQGDMASFLLTGAERVADAVGAVLRAVSATTPLVIVIEDVHWVDEGTLNVLTAILKQPLPGRVLLLITSRPPGTLTAPHLVRHELKAFEAGENHAHVRTLLGENEDLASSLQQELPVLEAGNPLFNSHIIRNLEVEGYLRRDADGVLRRTDRDMSDYVPPDSVSRALKRLSVHLDDDAVFVLGVAALMGRQFLVSDLWGLGLFDEATVTKALRAAQQYWLCTASKNIGWFVHDTLREYFEETVPADRLADIHGRIARQLQLRNTYQGTLGRHLERAGDTMAAVNAYYLAGKQADELNDPIAGTHFLRRAFELLIDAPDEVRQRAPKELLAQTAYELVRVGSTLGDTTDTLNLLDRCVASIAEPSPEEQAALASAYARLRYDIGDLPGSMTASMQCLNIVKAHPELSAYQCFPANHLGRAMCITGKYGPCIPVLTSGCKLAREAGEYDELSRSEGLLGVALAFCGHREKAIKRADYGLNLARRLGDPIRILGALVYRSAVSEPYFDWDTGIKHTTTLLALAEEQSIGGLYLYVGTGFAGRFQFHVGNLERARVLLENAINLSTIYNMKPILSWMLAWHGDTLFVSKAHKEARYYYSKGLEAAEATKGDAYAEPLCRIGLAHLLAVSGGDPAEVHRLAGESLAQLRSVSNTLTQIVVLQRYAEAMEAIGDGEAALRLRVEEAELRQRYGVKDGSFWPNVSESEEPAMVSPHAETVALLENLATISGYVPHTES